MYCSTYCMDHAHNYLDIRNEILALTLPRKSKVGKIPFILTLNSHMYLFIILTE